MTNEEEQYFRDMLSLVCAGCAYCWNSEKCKECLFSKLSERAIEALKERPHGKWIHRRIIAKNRSFDMVVCSNCQTEFSWDAETGISMDNYNTCPNCGSDNRKRGGEK